DILARLHVIGATSTTVAVIALLPFDLVGVAGGISVGVTIAAIYGMAKAQKLIGLTPRDTTAAIVEPALASICMVAVLTPLEFLVIDATSHGEVVDLLLLAGEVGFGLAVYTATLAFVARQTVRDIFSLIRRLLAKNGAPASAPDQVLDATK
ncbi:MAG TPA: polysaccharide biosynthesis C-terminal domain-containing protein, partial [Fimbriimonas sp.]|nr:polysaccharide biosynthesis C-terminal domain-containing protein [Fimbriimonas sp.]